MRTQSQQKQTNTRDKKSLLYKSFISLICTCFCAPSNEAVAVMKPGIQSFFEIARVATRILLTGDGTISYPVNKSAVVTAKAAVEAK